MIALVEITMELNANPGLAFLTFLTLQNTHSENTVEEGDGEEELEGEGPGEVGEAERLLQEDHVHRDHVDHVAVWKEP